jgi:hypothetical protein
MHVEAYPCTVLLVRSVHRVPETPLMMTNVLVLSV